MMRVLPFVVALTVVQESEQFNHEEVRTAGLRDPDRMVTDAAPMVRAVMTGPFK